MSSLMEEQHDNVMLAGRQNILDLLGASRPISLPPGLYYQFLSAEGGRSASGVGNGIERIWMRLRRPFEG